MLTPKESITQLTSDDPPVEMPDWVDDLHDVNALQRVSGKGAPPMRMKMCDS